MTRESHYKRRKKKKDKVENLYKILGTRSNIGQDRIKEKYIEKLRKFPPETHPEEFQEIRRAYETLKDVDKRKEYDMMRKYGGKISKVIDDVNSLISKEEFEKAQNLLDFALEIFPDDMIIKITQAKLFIEMKEIEKFQALIDEIIERCSTEEKQYVIFTRTYMLHSKGYYDEALDALEKDLAYITDMKKYHDVRAIIFLSSGNLQQAWEEFKDALPSKNNLTIEDLDNLTHWLNTGMELEKWGEISKIQSYFRKLSKAIVEEEESYMLKDRLLEEAELYIEVSRYREADVYMKLASRIYSKDMSIKERMKEIQPLVKLEMELSRSAKDQELIPYVHIKILEFFNEKYSNIESYKNFLNDYPHEMMKEMEWMKEDIAYGVLRIKKKYPSLYKEFNKELTELFNESTEGLNREQRRSLR